MNKRANRTYLIDVNKKFFTKSVKLIFLKKQDSLRNQKFKNF